MKIVVDVNLTPDWVHYLQVADFDAVHWSSVGPVNASDSAIARWAEENERVVLTSDLDFGGMLAVSGNDKPSVVQLRLDVTLPRLVGDRVIRSLKDAEGALRAGALLTLDHGRARVRTLPIGSGDSVDS